MEQRLANTWRMTINEKKFIETSLLSDLRVDGRHPFDYRRLTINFGREDGSSEVHLGQTRVMGVVTSQLVQPYRDRPNEGTLSVYTELSPMADPSFEAGRPGESAVELGRIIDRGLRESRAVDTESLCVVAGKVVWSIHIDIHILDNGGNLVDAANIAALAALSTFRRPECTLGGEDGQEVIVHPPEVREPVPLIIHHLPVAVTFGFIGKENIVVIDPTHFEEAVMGGSMTATLNTNEDVCAIQKAGGVGVLPSVIMQCLRVASVKAGDITSKIKSAVESFNTERSLRKIKRHTSSDVVDVSETAQKIDIEFSTNRMDRLKLLSEDRRVAQSNDMEVDCQISLEKGINKRYGDAKSFSGGPSSWDPYSKGVDPDALRASLASRAVIAPTKKLEDSKVDQPIDKERKQPITEDNSYVSPNEVTNTILQTNGEKTLIDAIKPKHRRRKKASSQQ
ncbi:Guanosine pentaphosphate synthetase I/polyribonucleotide nucleotidyltransferase [Heracleum sosnowskyi]|uniref:Protein ECERIFERUM 7 n=1 Tax=Heracleum sosnowskyi TaxID=360622 RepID=A0AAD8J9Y0_9APIA|nr:Guanosine pentaphosphate synthetase I/polyribonucleotide nucleotidyltransferase [Heracleum sosnowskyi]